MPRKLSFAITLLGCILVSLYLFPIGINGLPGNSKQLLGLFGILLFALKAVNGKNVGMSQSTVVSLMIACVFSLWCFFCVVINHTSDYSYASYVMSFSVWLGGAYGCCALLKQLCGWVDLPLVTKLMTITCIAQCILAQMIDDIPGLQNIVDTVVAQDTVPKMVNRLYGIGMSLDSGGVRLSVTEVLIAFQLMKNEHIVNDSRARWTYSIAFVLIAILGNMIARTTTVGVVLGLGYAFAEKGLREMRDITASKVQKLIGVLAALAAVIAICVSLYHSNADIRRQMHFAFEGFFSFVETGKFETGSSNQLNDRMWVWPTDERGWIVGYGAFNASERTFDQTDIGYCRFTMYCGLTGFIIFALLFVYNAYVFARKYRRAVMCACVLLAMSFIIWIKVSTDLFQFYALLICLPAGAGGAGALLEYVPEDEDAA